MEQTITFRVESEQKELIRQVSKQSGLNMGSYCRFVVLQTIEPIKEVENDQDE